MNINPKVMFICFQTIFFIIFIVIIISTLSNNKKNHKNVITASELQIKYKDIINKIYNMIINDEELNKNRIEHNKNLKTGITLILAGFLLSFILGLGIPLIIAGVIYLIKLSKNSYSDSYKEKIVQFALKEYDDNLEYYPTGCIPEEQYEIADFENYDRFYSEDRINGTILGHNFIMADVHVEDRREDSDGDTTYVTLFNGPVAIVQLPKSIDFELSIENDSIKLFNRKKIVEIDNPDFEEIYDVYTNDKVKAMVVLTPAVTNRMLDLYNKYGFVFEFKFVKNYMYFRFHSGSLFVPNANSPMDEAVGVARYFEIIDGIKDIMKGVIESTESVRR